MFVSIVLVVVFVLVLSVVALLLVVSYISSGCLRCSITFVTHARTRQESISNSLREVPVSLVGFIFMLTVFIRF